MKQVSISVAGDEVSVVIDLILFDYDLNDALKQD